MLTIFIDISIVHIQTSNTVVQRINIFIMSPILYTMVNTFLRVEYSVENKNFFLNTCLLS